MSSLSKTVKYTDSYDVVTDAINDLKNYWEECKCKNVVLKSATVLSLVTNLKQSNLANTGLSPEHILDCSAIIVSDLFQDRVKIMLLEAMIPHSVVPTNAVTTLLMWIVSNKASIKLKGVVLRWILLVLDFMESKQELSALYFLTFNLLFSENIRSNACRLLNVLTRKCDVTPWRIQTLKSVCRDAEGNNACVMSLLATYKAFRPDLVILSTSVNLKQAFARNIDRVWAERIQRVQCLHSGIPAHTNILAGLPVAKRRKIERYLPPVQSSALVAVNNLSTSNSDLTLTTLGLKKIALADDLKTVESVIDNIECAELPDRIGTVLGNESIRLLMRMAPNATASIRLNNWLSSVLAEEFFNATKVDKKSQNILLQSICCFCEAMMDAIKPCSDFLSRYIPQWNGVDHVTEILKLLSWLRISSSDAFYESCLEPLRKLVLVSSVEFQCNVFDCFHNWLRHAAICESKILNQSSPAYDINKTVSDTENSLESISMFIEYVGSLSSVLLQMSSNLKLQYSIYNFYIMASRLMQDHAVLCVTLPPKYIIYHGLFNSCAEILDMACQIMLNYRVAYTELQQLDVSKLSEAKLAARSALLNNSNVVTYNVYLLDYCNCLWRSGAFYATDTNKNSIFQSFAAFQVELCEATGIVPELLTRMLTIYLHPALISFAIRFLQTTQPSDKLVHPTALQSIRDQFLTYLKQEGLEGIANLIHNSIVRRSYVVSNSNVP